MNIPSSESITQVGITNLLVHIKETSAHISTNFKYTLPLFFLSYTEIL